VAHHASCEVVSLAVPRLCLPHGHCRATSVAVLCQPWLHPSPVSSLAPFLALLGVEPQLFCALSMCGGVRYFTPCYFVVVNNESCVVS
jgi:hypothetical protein